MKIKSAACMVLASAFLLQGCDSNDGILDDDRDTYHLTPTPPTPLDPTIPTPPENASVIQTNSGQILDVNGNPVLLRGVNTFYAEDPTAKRDNIAAVKSTGANVVSISLTKSTTAEQLRAALDSVVANDLIAILSFSGPDGEISCTSEQRYVDEAVGTYWLNNWMSVLADAAYQSHMMINIADNWGPLNIFSAVERFSYQPYIETYKEYIYRFRQAGFKVPLVIDAPGCGQDYAAFLSSRDLELLAADSEKNLVFSVNGAGQVWDSHSEMLRNLGYLQRLAAPVIIGEFGGGGAVDTDVFNYSLLLEMAMGDNAMRLSLPWERTDDSVTIAYELPSVRDAVGLRVDMQLYVPQSYYDADTADDEDSVMGVQLVLIDENGEYGFLRARYAANFFPHAWNLLINTISTDRDIVSRSDGFDASRVEKIGVRLTANGKPTDVVGDFLIDNVVVAVKPDPIYFADFTNGSSDWSYAGWGAPGIGGTANTHVENGSLAVLAEWNADANQAVLNSNTIGTAAQTLDQQEPFTVSFEIFVPEEYQLEADMTVRAYLTDGTDDYVFGGFPTIIYRAPEFTFGEWNTITIDVPNMESVILNDGWEGNDHYDANLPPRAFGILINGIRSAKTEAILIDNVRIDSSLSEVVGFVPEYEADLNNWVFGWGTGSQDDLAVDGDGTMSVHPDWAETAGQNITTVQWGLDSSGHSIDLSNPFRMSVELFIPDEYTSETDMAFQPFFFDGIDGGTFGSLGYFRVAQSIPTGEWYSFEVSFADYNETGPNRAEVDLSVDISGIGVEFTQISSPKTEAIRFRNVKIDMIEVIDAEILSLDFTDSQQVTDFELIEDPALTSMDINALSGETTKVHTLGLQPFGWLANGWKSADADLQPYDLSNIEGFIVEGDADSGLDLTERGEDIVNGVFGIFSTSTPAGFGP